MFNRLFFPSSDPALATLAAFGAFASGLLARPIGGIVFGHYGDRIGRKSMLTLSLLMMGVCTVLIGLLPTYESIGLRVARRPFEVRPLVGLHPDTRMQRKPRVLRDTFPGLIL